MAIELVQVFAPAKLNLCLHVTGRRPDGYHLLDSLVAFASVGDRVSADIGPELALRITGPEAADLAAGPDNLVLRAARAMGVDATLVLEKVLPLASGIGGGSADAAAALRALADLTGRPLPPIEDVLRLGADVPVCLAGRPARMSGIGEVLHPLPPLPPMACVLVNPRLPIPTPPVFAALTRRDNPPLPDLPSSALASAPALAAWLATRTRNDLAAPARQVAPILVEVQAALEATPACLLARMSGSGGTHFGLFATPAAAAAAAEALATTHPAWWVTAGRILD